MIELSRSNEHSHPHCRSDSVRIPSWISRVSPASNNQYFEFESSKSPSKSMQNRDLERLPSQNLFQRPRHKSSRRLAHLVQTVLEKGEQNTGFAADEKVFPDQRRPRNLLRGNSQPTAQSLCEARSVESCFENQTALATH